MLDNLDNYMLDNNHIIVYIEFFDYLAKQQQLCFHQT